MSLIMVVIWIALLGLAVWALTSYVPMPPVFRTIIIVVAALVVILWLIQLFGVMGPTVPALPRR
jgi:hypothetical protein